MSAQPANLVAFVRSKGWTAEPTPRGRLKLTKGGSCVFVASPDAGPDVLAEAIKRIGYIDGMLARAAERRP